MPGVLPAEQARRPWQGCQGSSGRRLIPSKFWTRIGGYNRENYRREAAGGGSPLPHPFPSTWNPGNPETKLFVTIAEIITDDGIHGYGAACDSSQLLAGIWDTHIRPLVIGKEITQVEAINTGLVNASLYAYRPWCVEVAVWDALGKYANLPIYKMLGGVQDKVLAYASTGSLKSVEERVEDAERYIAEGFKMMKLRAHHDDPFEDVRIIAEIKKRVGDKLKIAVDANQGWFFTGKRSVAKWDLKKALNVCRAFEEIGIEWIEEPLYGYDFEGLAELRKRTTLHVAGGELNAQVHEYRDLIKHNCFDIYQMDVVLSGGFVQNRKVAAMAEAENKIYTPHTWTHGMGMAAALHMAGAVSNCPFIEYCYDPPYWPYEVRDMMLTEPLVVDKDGYIAVPQKPGLGVEINHELMDKYTVLRK
ncbi:MAG: mandelate racemase/muconate lactonizing enzyme family protein [Vescimonas sp.]